MNGKLAVLGPIGTFSDIASKRYMNGMGIDFERFFYPTMKKTIEAVVDDTCRYGLIPIENTLDGYVQVVLDLLTTMDVKIIHEVVVPVRFAFVANCDDLSKVEKIYVQFKSENQCSEFLGAFPEVDIITTQSNSQSYKSALEGKSCEGAIIPMHMLDETTPFNLIKEDVADSLDNETRFIIVAKHLNEEVDTFKSWKTSLMVSYAHDRPGLLADILGIFSKQNINMMSIMSRPTKSGLGLYNFFIDIEGCYQKDPRVREAVAIILDKYKIKILGSYYRIQD